MSAPDHSAAATFAHLAAWLAGATGLPVRPAYSGEGVPGTGAFATLQWVSTLTGSEHPHAVGYDEAQDTATAPRHVTHRFSAQIHRDGGAAAVERARAHADVLQAATLANGAVVRRIGNATALPAIADNAWEARVRVTIDVGATLHIPVPGAAMADAPITLTPVTDPAKGNPT